jgi:hypothetical protein
MMQISKGFCAECFTSTEPSDCTAYVSAVVTSPSNTLPSMNYSVSLITTNCLQWNMVSTPQTHYALNFFGSAILAAVNCPKRQTSLRVALIDFRNLIRIL